MAKNKGAICEFKLPEKRGLSEKCNRKVEDGEKFCIFHREEKDNEEFRRQIEKYIEETTDRYTEASEIEKESIYLDFSGFRFPDCTPYFKKNLFFLDCLFTKAVFKDIACFENSHFKKRVFFENTEFLKKADFNNATFESFTKFSRCVFDGPANFKAATFSGRIYFVGAVFKKPIEFNIGRVENEIHFVGCVTKNVYFWAVTTTRNALVYFNKIDLSKWAFAFTVGVENFVFTDCTWQRRIGPPRFFTLDEILSEKGFIKYEPVIEVYRKLRANFEKNHVYGVASDFHIGEMDMVRYSISPIPWFLDLYYKFKDQKFLVRIWAPFQLLIFNWTTRLDRIFAKFTKRGRAKGRAKIASNINIYTLMVLFGFMEFRKKKEKRKTFKTKWWIAARYYVTSIRSRVSRVKTFRWFLLSAYKYISNYGESTGRPVFWLGLLVILAAIIFMLIGIPVPGHSINWDLALPISAFEPSACTLWELIKDFFRAVWFSIQSFFTFRTGVYGVLSWGQFVATLQRILGYTLATLFILALRRAFRR